MRRTIITQIVLAFEREHGIDQIVPRALLAQLDFQAVGEEGRADLGRPRSARACGEHLTAARNANLVVEHEPDHAQRRATQRIRVLRSGRLLVDRPEAGEHVDLVGERDRDRHRIGRHQIVRPLRLVVILDGVRDRFVLALRLRVVAAHQALHFGKLADHFGQQIGLAELRRAFGLGDIGADDRRKMAGKRDDARDPLGLGAELLVEHDVLELRQPVFRAAS